MIERRSGTEFLCALPDGARDVRLMPYDGGVIVLSSNQPPFFFSSEGEKVEFKIPYGAITAALHG